MGSLSGPVGSALIPGVRAVQVWVKHVNARGGLNGHEILLFVYDDGTDPARHKAQVQEAIEQKKVVAFVYNAEGITGGSSVAYITSKRVPVIGSEGTGPWFYESPMYFPQQPHADFLYISNMYGAAGVLVPAGKTKLGTITCEVQRCADADQTWGKTASKAGFGHVYRGRASIAQPDYTAECLAARNAGAQALMVILDPTSISRLALSCARQGYHPTFATLASLAVDRFKADPNLDGMYATSPLFPYFQSGTPATDEYRQALRAYDEKAEPSVGLATGWVAAKLFEKAAAIMPEPPTSEAVLQGLWSIRQDTLDGLTMPLSFLENKPAPPQICWYDIEITQSAWRSTDGYKSHCHQT